MNQRRYCYDILNKIERKKLFCDQALKEALSVEGLDQQKKAFITRIIEGVIENKIFIDYIINQFSKIKTKKMDLEIRTILKLAVYEIYFMDSIPPRATINEYVELTKTTKFSYLSGFVNANLRKIASTKLDTSQLPNNILYSFPEELWNYCLDVFGLEETVKIASNSLDDKGYFIRINNLEYMNDILFELKNNEIDYEPFENEYGITNSIKVYKGNVVNLDCFKKGYITIQDFSSCLVSHFALKDKEILDVENILDACASPGGKTCDLALKCPTSKVLACDISDEKIELIKENLQRQNIANVTCAVSDACLFDKSKIAKYDLVLCDCPCSGLGVISRKPDIKYNFSLEKITSLVEIQRSILENTSHYVKTYGRLVYSTCTITKEENEYMTSWFLNNYSQFKKIDEIRIMPKFSDGFYIAVFEKWK